MRRRHKLTAFFKSTSLLLAAGLLVLNVPRAGAQSADSLRWSLFAGRTTSSAASADKSFNLPSQNFNVGARVELTPRLFPVPLRATLSYDKFRGGETTTLKATSLTIDAVFRPLPAVKGVRPYLLGGIGIATVSPSGTQVVEGGMLRVIPIARTTALEMNTGLGLEFRRFFLEYQHSPYHLLGHEMPLRTPIRRGFMF
jgi:hypothetical protein